MMRKPASRGPGAAGPGEPDAAPRRSQQRWRREREYLNAHRHDLSQVAQDLYPLSWRVAGTSLLARPEWRPARPVPLEQVTLSWHAGESGTVIDAVQPAGSEGVRPLRDDGTRFASYADALAALSRPRLLENRTCYRLLAAGTADGRGRADLRREPLFRPDQRQRGGRPRNGGRVLAARKPRWR